MNNPDIEQLQDELRTLKHELAQTARATRRRRIALLGVLAVGASLWSLLAWASGGTYDCTANGPLPFGLNCYAPNTPAIANEMNFNFNTVATHIADLETSNTSVLSRLTNLESGVTKLNGTTYFPDGGSATPRIVTGSAGGACGQAFNSPCNVTFSPAFHSAPVCTAMAVSPDTTGYNENVLATGISPSGLSVWKGQYLTSGVTLTFYYVCVGY